MAVSKIQLPPGVPPHASYFEQPETQAFADYLDGIEAAVVERALKLLEEGDEDAPEAIVALSEMAYQPPVEVERPSDEIYNEHFRGNRRASEALTRLHLDPHMAPFFLRGTVVRREVPKKVQVPKKVPSKNEVSPSGAARVVGDSQSATKKVTSDNIDAVIGAAAFAQAKVGGIIPDYVVPGNRWATVHDLTQRLFTMIYAASWIEGCMQNRWCDNVAEIVRSGSDGVSIAKIEFYLRQLVSVFGSKSAKPKEVMLSFRGYRNRAALRSKFRQEINEYIARMEPRLAAMERKFPGREQVRTTRIRIDQLGAIDPEKSTARREAAELKDFINYWVSVLETE